MQINGMLLLCDQKPRLGRNNSCLAWERGAGGGGVLVTPPPGHVTKQGGPGACGPVLTPVPGSSAPPSLWKDCGRRAHLFLLPEKCSYQKGVMESTPAQFLERPLGLTLKSF